MRDVHFYATVVQLLVGQPLDPRGPLALAEALFVRTHQDVFAEVLRRQAEVDERGAERQRLAQLQEGQVVVVAIRVKFFMDVQSPDREVPLLVA